MVGDETNMDDIPETLLVIYVANSGLTINTKSLLFVGFLPFSLVKRPVDINI